MIKSIEALNYPLLPDEAYAIVGKDYQDNVYRTQAEVSDIDPKTAAVLRDIVGLNGEVGELTDILKKVVFHEGQSILVIPFDKEEELRKELGDVM